MGGAQGIDRPGGRAFARSGVGLVEPGDCGEPCVTDAFGGDGRLREGGRVGVPEGG